MRSCVRAVVVSLLAAAVHLPALAGLSGSALDQRLAAAVALQELGSHDEAIAAYREILAAAPNEPRALAGLAFSAYVKGDYEGTVALAERILATGKDSPPGVYLIVGSAYGMLGHWDKAEEVLLLGQSVWPRDESLRFNRAINLFAQGRFETAIEELESCIRSSPYRPEYWKALGDALAGSGAPGRAFAAYARAATLEEDRDRARVLSDRLWTLIFETAPSVTSGTTDDTEAAESMGLSLVGRLRRDAFWKDRSDATFFVYALDNVLRLVAALNAKGRQADFWGPFALAYFDDLRRAGHMESLAYDIRRATDDPEAETWCRVNADRAAEFRVWSERWAVNWSRVTRASVSVTR